MSQQAHKIFWGGSIEQNCNQKFTIVHITEKNYDLKQLDFSI